MVDRTRSEARRCNLLAIELPRQAHAERAPLPRGQPRYDSSRVAANAGTGLGAPHPPPQLLEPVGDYDESLGFRSSPGARVGRDVLWNHEPISIGV